MSNIDWDFIARQEGKRVLNGYVPKTKNMKSGVTIATGFDLGQRNLNDLKGLPEFIVKKLEPYLGIKGANAEQLAENLNITDSEAKIIDEFSHSEVVEDLRKKWNAKTGTSFDDLPTNKATAIASVRFQHGDLATATPNFWRQVTSDDWNAAINNLRDFGDEFPSRRNREADYLVAGMSTEEVESKKKFESELARDKKYGIQQAMISGEEGGLGSIATTERIKAKETDFDSEPVKPSEFVEESTDLVEQPASTPPLSIHHPAEEADEVYDDAIIRQAMKPEVEYSASEYVKDFLLGEGRTSERDDEYFTLEDVNMMEAEEIVNANEVNNVADTFFSLADKIPDNYEEERKRLQQEDITLDELVQQRKALGYTRYQEDRPQLDKFFQFRNKTRYGDVYVKPDPESFELDAFQDTNTFEHVFATAGKAFRQYNPITAGARFAQYTGLISGRPKPVPGYSVYDSEIAKKLVTPEGLGFYDAVGSDEEFLLRFNRKQKDLEDLEIINKSPHGQGLSLFMATAGPTLLAPIAPIKILRHHGATHRFIAGGTFGAATMAGQQTALMTQNDARDAEEGLMTLTAAFLINGSLSSLLGKNISAQHKLKLENNKLLKEQQKIAALGARKGINEAVAKGEVGALKAESVGAGVSDEIRRTRAYQQIEREALEATGVGFEKLPINPVNRLAKSPNPLVRSVTPELVDMGGVMQRKIRDGEEAMHQSVEKIAQVRYYPMLRRAKVLSSQEYAKYRGELPKQGDIGLAARGMTRGVQDFLSMPPNTLTYRQFRERAGKAFRNGDKDRVRDAATKHVNAVAREYRKLVDDLGNEANKVGLFSVELKNLLDDAIAAGDDALVAKIRNAMVVMRRTGPAVNTAKSYMPRVYRGDKIDANMKKFIDQVVKGLRQKNPKLSAKEARIIATESMDAALRRKPYLDFDGRTDALDFVKLPSGAQARLLDIPDRLIEDFLENDIEAVIGMHTRQMSIDIELTRKFGDIGLVGFIKQVDDEYVRLLKETKDVTMRKSIQEARKRDLDDIRAVRDRLRGTYGASKDPHAMSSRYIRAMKSINILTGMGSAAISSLPDTARIPMVEGFQAFYKGLNVMFFEASKIAARMTKTELEEAAVAIDAQLGLRAHAMVDSTDIFGNRYGLERSLTDATGAMFFFNGLNIWNQVIKETAGNVVALRMVAAIMNPKGWDGLDQPNKEKLLKNGIGRQDYDIMRMQIEQHGVKEQGRWLPNTSDWTDSTQRLKFRVALNQNVDRIIITPGAGDRALWTSTEVGSLLTQFKGFGQGAFVRMLTAGLQEKDGAFWQGALMIVALAGIVNEIKRVQYGIDRDEDFEQKLINAIDRSGLMGWFTDVNNAAEALSHNQIGFRPLFGEDPYPVSAQVQAARTVGPTGSFVINAGSVLGDVLSGNVDEQTGRNARFIQPGGNLAIIDPILDGVYGHGNVNRQENLNKE